MRLLLVYLLLSISLTTYAQPSERASLNAEINEDDKTCSIRVDGDRNGKSIHYNRTFNVVGQSKEQKESLKNRVLDSLGLGETPPPPALPTGAIEPAPVKVTFVHLGCTGKTKLSVNGSGFLVDREVAITKGKPGFSFDLDMPPGEYQYTYWQNRVEQMRLPFTVKAGGQNVVTVK